MFAPFEHEENGTQYFVTQRHDGALVSTLHEERLEFCFESRSGSAGSVSKFTQKTTDIGVAFSYSSGFVLAR